MKERTKEMVIRKIMGSQPWEIMIMVTGDFSKWILAAVILAAPTAYLLMNEWLDNFAYHIKIGTDVFIYSIILTMLISLIVISYHVIKLSTVNPVERIRHE
jgi:putative ABC transport system permease protein